METRDVLQAEIVKLYDELRNLRDRATYRSNELVRDNVEVQLSDRRVSAAYASAYDFCMMRLERLLTGDRHAGPPSMAFLEELRERARRAARSRDCYEIAGFVQDLYREAGVDPNTVDFEPREAAE